MMSSKFIRTSIISLLAVFVIVYIGIQLTSKKAPINEQNAEERLNELYAGITVNQVSPVKGEIDLSPADVGQSLPDIAKFPLTTTHSSDHYVEIFSSTEKAGKGVDGWLTEVATAFNQANIQVDGSVASVDVRNIASGTAADYIVSGKYVPDAFAPSNELWGEIIKNAGIKATIISPRLVGNTAGIVISKSKRDSLVSKYGKLNSKTIAEAVIKGDLVMGYTDPFTSSTGLNFLVSAINQFDSDPLSEKSMKTFEEFQAHIPFTASTTLQIREATKSGKLDAFVLEYQTYVNADDLKNDYEYIPIGVRHDNPLYALGELPAEKRKILTAFADFAREKQNQQLANDKGFNQFNDYQSEYQLPGGKFLSDAQQLWKQKKNGNRAVSAVFVADVSGSMEGEPIAKLRESLIQGQKYLGKDNRIGLISYSNEVNVNLPINTYTIDQQGLFVGAANSLTEGGRTATFDAIVVALKMLADDKKANPNIKPLIFVLSDGETNTGTDISAVEELLRVYKIPVYTIGYNADIQALKTISDINEASSINAYTDDVIYKIRNLLNSQM